MSALQVDLRLAAEVEELDLVVGGHIHIFDDDDDDDYVLGGRAQSLFLVYWNPSFRGGSESMVIVFVWKMFCIHVLYI